MAGANKKHQAKWKAKSALAKKRYRAYKKSNPSGQKKYTTFVKEAWGK